MSRWWDTSVGNAGVNLYSDPSAAMAAAQVPVELTQTQSEYKQDQEQAHKDQGGFMGTIAKAVGKVDGALSHVPGYDSVFKPVANALVWQPLDKTASGFRYLYSNFVSQPISAMLLHSARLEAEGKSQFSDIGGLFGGTDWQHAEHVSPGEAFSNIENVKTAMGESTLGIWGAEGAHLSDAEKDEVRRNQVRFLYDSDFWRNKSDWKYNVGSGSLDFMFNLLDPIGNVAVGTATKSIKAARSIELTPNVAYKTTDVLTRPADDITFRGKTLLEGYKSRAIQPTMEGAPSYIRTRGPVVDYFKAGDTPAEIANSAQFQKAFDWMKADGRTVEQIASHPMWGRGRRINPARYDIAKLVHDAPREELPLLWRFGAGDSSAGKELADRAPELLKNIGKVVDNRILVDSIKIDPDMVARFKANGDPNLVSDPNLLVEPPYPRPTTPGPRQDGWDRTWGALAEKSAKNRFVAEQIRQSTPVRLLHPAENTTLADAEKAKAWKAAQLDVLANDYNDLLANESYLARALGGNMEDWTPSSSPIFGTIQKAYRMGPLALRDTEMAAQSAALRKAGRRPAIRPTGNFLVTTYKRGMAAPMTFIHAFGDRTPQGFVNHNAEDAHDRVFDMLKQVRTMEPQQRLDLIELYNQANNKMERSDALQKIHNAILDHMLVNDHGMDRELASALSDSLQGKISDKLLQLTRKRSQGPQVFGAKAETPEDVQALTGEVGDSVARSDVVTMEDGSGVVISPLAQTQLNASDILLPVKEIERLISRSASPMRKVRIEGGDKMDILTKYLDSFDNLWKFATLLRPGFIPRMISDEILARMFKFGAMSTMLDTGTGMAHFLSNRARQVGSIVGVSSYAPSTGAGIASKHTRVVLDDQAAITIAKRQGLKTSAVKVAPTVSMAHARITKDTQTLKELETEITEALKDGSNASPEYIAALHGEYTDVKATIGEYHDYIGALLAKAEDSTGKRLGEGTFSYTLGGKTYTVKEAFNRDYAAPIPRDQISSENSWKALFSREEMIDRTRFMSHMEKTGYYTYVTPDRENHMQSWLDALNKQIRQDPFHRMVAEGRTDAQLKQWMNSAQGRKYMSNMGAWNRNTDQFIRSVRYNMDKYLADSSLQAKLGKGELITEADLRAAFAPTEFPVVHGEEIKELSALHYRETAKARLDKYVEKAWKRVADIPADVMSRNPTYLQMHKAQMQRILREQYHYKMQNYGTDEITPQEWEQMNQKAHNAAKHELRQVVYDPNNTDGSAALRFVYPFFKPYIDGLDRWAGLVAERPEQLTRVAQIYNAPVAANLVTDQGGNTVGVDGYSTVTTYDEKGKPHKQKVFVPLKDRVLHFKAPWGKQGSKEYLSPIRMGSLNTILPGDPWFDPGTGPIIQVTGNELAKTSPSVGEFLQWAKILPYGPSESTSDLLIPKYMKSAYAAYMGTTEESGQKYQDAVRAVYAMKTAQWHEQMKTDKHAEPPTMKEVQAEAKKFLWLQALTDWSSPASVKSSPLTGTRYQFFADQLKALQKADPKNGTDRFLAMHGEDYIAFTTATTKSMGIAASMSAEKQAEKYKDQIAEDPDMASLWIGDVYNGGPFSSSVYNKQMQEEIGGVPVRQKLTAEQSIVQTRIQEGWRQYMQAAQALDSTLLRQGFTSYAQRGAEGFAEKKRMLVQNLAQQNPAWYKAYSTTDRNIIPRRIMAMQRMVQDPRIMNDPLRKDAKVLSEYLMVRDAFKRQLAQRGLQQLSFAPGNERNTPIGQAADIGYAWRQAQMYFVNKSVAFGKLYNRYLAQDDLQ